MGTMGYKHEAMAGNGERTTRHAVEDPGQPEIIPGVDGSAEICQLVGSI